MTDNRCPACNKIIQGRQEVSMGKPRKPATICPHCKTQVRLALSKDDLGECYSYAKK